MDQLKEQLAGVIKYGFWILCGISVVGALGISFWQASSLAKERDSQITKIEADKTSMTSIQSSISTHPNDKVKTEMDTLMHGRRKPRREAF